ncbi:hypothetical protein ACRTC3_16435 [Photobacterium damselae]|uniref:hypothetical protein n=1 Tax=Photobacterium damselae TaxID=38293 RepID=UPI003D7CE438
MNKTIKANLVGFLICIFLFVLFYQFNGKQQLEMEQIRLNIELKKIEIEQGKILLDELSKPDINYDY